MIGAVAKAVATTVTYPLQTIQSILRVGLFVFGSLFRRDENCCWLKFWFQHLHRSTVGKLKLNVKKKSVKSYFVKNGVDFKFWFLNSSAGSGGQQTSQNYCPVWGQLGLYWSIEQGGCTKRDHMLRFSIEVLFLSLIYFHVSYFRYFAQCRAEACMTLKAFRFSGTKNWF